MIKKASGNIALCFKNQDGDPKWLDDIRKDLHRNFPTHELFGGTFENIGQGELFEVLKAYTIYNPTEGYCQAQAPIAAMLLMNMPSEKAFWYVYKNFDYKLY